MGNSKKSKGLIYFAYIVMSLGGVLSTLANQKGLPIVYGVGIAVTFFSGVFVIVSIYKKQQNIESVFQSRIASKGQRHEVIIKNVNARSVLKEWADRAGYKVHSASSDSKVVYSKGGSLLIPIFVSYDFEGCKLEAWIQREDHAFSIFDGPVISIPHKIARKDFETLASKFGVLSARGRRSI